MAVQPDLAREFTTIVNLPRITVDRPVIQAAHSRVLPHR